MDEEFQIFISYAHRDREPAEELYDWLKQEGFVPWIDFKKIKGGQNWDFEIKRALDRSAIVIVLWSENSRDHRGYVQRELKIALDKLQEKLIDDIFIIPVRLDETTEIPQHMASIHFLSANAPNFRKELADAIVHQIERLGGERKQLQKDQDVYWRSTVIKEEWHGLPGYAVEIQLLDFTSDTYPSVQQIGQYVRGNLLEHLFDARRIKLDQSLELHNFAQDKWARTNTFDAICGDPILCNKIITLNYVVNWYNAGAAHPTHAHKTFAFLLDPLIKIDSLQRIFLKPEQAFPILQRHAREQLANYRAPWESDEDTESNPVSGLDEEWVHEGTKQWSDFRAFVFNNDTLDIYFSSYQVAAYAFGMPHVSVPYSVLATLIRDEYVTALNIRQYTYD